MALRGEPTKLSCFSWPSLWVFRLKWNPMGCELKRKNIFWKAQFAELGEESNQIKPPSCSALLSLKKKGLPPWLGALSPRWLWIPVHSCSWPVPVPSEARQLLSWGLWGAGYAGKVKLCWESHRSMARLSIPREVGSGSSQTIAIFCTEKPGVTERLGSGMGI